jgi:exopolysaccharide biosynthesis polyprenyl glycosylphosphotransferase
MYRKNSNSWLKHLDFEILDLICLELAFYFAYWFRHRDTFLFFPSMYVKLGILLAIFDVVAIFFSQSYKHVLHRDRWQELVAVIQHVSIIELMLLLYEYVAKEAELFSRTVFLLSWAVAVLCIWLVRTCWKNILRRNILKGKNKSNMLIITSGEHITTCIKQLREKEYRDFEISAVALLNEDTKPERIDANIPILYGYEPLVEYIRKDIVDEVYIDIFRDKAELEKLMDMFLKMGVTVHIGMGFLPSGLPNLFMEKIGTAQAITTTIKTATGLEITLKRLMDILGGAVGLLLTGIAYIFVAPAIKKASPGPVFFKQQRVGKNGRIFHIYKFRSMYLDAEERLKELMAQNEMQGLMFKMENDPRIIGSEKGPGKGIGNFIRKTSIDELPQFWNILKGDMSLVGTRPPTVGEYEQYDLHHKIRLSMKPGLTGMWQTSGRNEITDFEEVVKLDAEYIHKWSIWLDIRLLFKTVKVVLERKGSK